MSIAQVANSGIVSGSSRAMARGAVASSAQYVDPLSGAFASPPRDQAPNFDDSGDDFEAPRRRRRYSSYQDQVVSFGGVLVSREVGAAIMREQASATSHPYEPLPVEAERSIAVYEFNQSLMGVAEPVTEAFSPN